MSVAGIGAVTDEALEAERVDLRAGEPDCLCSAAEVAAGVLRGAGEVVLAAGRDLLGEVAPAGGAELRQAHHGRDAPKSGARAERTSSAAVSGGGSTKTSYDRREKPCKWRNPKQ